MKDCTHCKYASWDKTATGRLHPSGDGWCQYQYVMPKLPESMYWLSLKPPSPSGGYINRRQPLKNDCVYFGRP